MYALHFTSFMKFFEAANILIGFFQWAMLIFIGKFDGRRNELISEKNLMGERDCTSWGPTIFWSKIAKANVDENERVMMNVRSLEFESSGVVLQSRALGFSYQTRKHKLMKWALWYYFISKQVGKSRDGGLLAQFLKVSSPLNMFCCKKCFSRK